MSDELPSGWVSVSLGELADPAAPIIYGILQPGPEVPSGVPYVRPTEIRGDVIQLDQIRRTSKEIAEKYARASLREGDVLLSIVGTIGKVAVVPHQLSGGNITQSSVRIRPGVAIERNFVRHLLKSPALTRQYDKHRLGTGVPRLNVAHVRELRCLLPPLNEQRRIVAKLEALQARSRTAREALDAVPPLLEKLRQSILAAAFRGDLTKDWREKHPDVEPASELLKRIRIERRKKWEEAELAKMKAKGKVPRDERWKAKYSDKSCELAESSLLQPENLPAAWDCVPIGEVADFQQGMQIARSTRHTEPAPDRLPILRTVNYRDGFSSDVHYVNVIRGTLVAEKADIILSRTGTVGQVLTGVRGVFHNNSFRVNYDGANIHREYLLLFLKSSIAQQHIRLGAGRTAQPDLTHKAFGPCPFPVAPLNEQREVTRRALGLLRLADAVEEAMPTARLEALSQSILAKAFRGELVPQDPNDEPALVMLERIKAEASGDNGAAGKKKGRGRARRT